MASLSEILQRATSSQGDISIFDNETQIVLECLLKGRIHQAALMNGMDDEFAEVALVGLNRSPLAEPADFQALIVDLQRIGH